MNLGGLMDLSDLIGSLIGAFLGFAGAYALLHLQRAQEVNSDLQGKKQYFSYAVDLLGRAIPGWEEAIEKHRGLADATRKNPFELHPHTISINVAQRTLHHSERSRVREGALQFMVAHEANEVNQKLFGAAEAFAEFSSWGTQAIVSGKEDVNAHLARFNQGYMELLSALKDITSGNSIYWAKHKDTVKLRESLDEAQRLAQRAEGSTMMEILENVVFPIVRLETNAVYDSTEFSVVSQILSRLRDAAARARRSSIELSDLALRLATQMEVELEKAKRLHLKLSALAHD